MGASADEHRSEAPATASTTPLIRVRDLHKHFPERRGLFGGTGRVLRAVDGISFQVHPGKTLSLVGESGCGKSTTANLMLGLDEPTSGEVLWQERDIKPMSKHERREYRRGVNAVFQDPMSSLDPRIRIGDSVVEPLVEYGGVNAGERKQRLAEVLHKVGLRPDDTQRFPHEFSGGQRQRIAIARALIVKPHLIVLDEPVSSLDVSIRAQVMNLLKDLQQSTGVAYLVISHNLSTVRFLSHDIAVMYLGKIVESGPEEAIFTKPHHPYTRALISAALPDRPDQRRPAPPVGGEVPSPFAIPPGCRFHPRCPEAMRGCRTIAPIETRTPEGATVACHLWGAPPQWHTDPSNSVPLAQTREAFSLPRQPDDVKPKAWRER